MRITFWGVQGSCPIFPSMEEVVDFSRRVAIYTLIRTFEGLSKIDSKAGNPIHQLLGDVPTYQNIEAYHYRLGLPELPVYGGDTTCVEVETSEGNVLIFDGGSGIRHCSKSLVQRWADREERELHIFGSHEHLDHRSGLPFASICLVRPNPFKLNIYGNRNFLKSLDERFGVFSHIMTEMTHRDDPLDYTDMSATFTGTEIRDLSSGNASASRLSECWAIHDQNEPIRIGSTLITAFSVYHGSINCLAYKIEHAGSTFVFCTDYEYRQGLEKDDPRQVESEKSEERLLQHARGAEALYIDGQYFKAEYMGIRGIGSSPPVSRTDWGHSVIEHNIERSIKNKIKRTYIGHHDPERSWPERMQIDNELAVICANRPEHIELAKGGMIIEI